jgi:UDP-glucuronate 4-epimerase
MAVVLVTGAAGFIGSHVAEALLLRGDEIIGLDDVNDYYSVANKRHNLTILGQHSKFRCVQGDICDAECVESIFANHDVRRVAHLAARAGVRPSIKSPALYQTTNVGGTLTLLDAAMRHGVDNFVLTSSSSVYGNSTAVPFVEDDSATDRPISPYAATKKCCELLGFTYHALHGLNVNIIRPFTVYGPRGRPDMAPWLFVQAALENRPIQKFGDGTSARDYTYIDDFVAGYVQAIDREMGFEILNLGNSATVSLNEAIATVSEIHGSDLQVTATSTQPGDVRITHANIDKARRLLDYAPRTSFHEGMTRFYDWFQSRASTGTG